MPCPNKNTDIIQRKLNFFPSLVINTTAIGASKMLGRFEYKKQFASSVVVKLSDSSRAGYNTAGMSWMERVPIDIELTKNSEITCKYSGDSLSLFLLFFFDTFTNFSS